MRVGRHVRGVLATAIKSGRKDTLWRMATKGGDKCMCYVCGRVIKQQQQATLEHIVPMSLGGTDDMDNLALSHGGCNALRGNRQDYIHPARREAGA